MNHEPKQIALISLYLACKVEEVPFERIKAMADQFRSDLKHDLKIHLVHFNSESKPFSLGTIFS